MTPERLAKLFTPFLTAPGAQSGAGYTGTGLGMTLCKRMVEQARGEMHAWSTRGKGTCIRVILPAA
jgi:signal transduction histidine kinase